MTDTLNLLRPYLRGWPIIVGMMVLSYLLATKYLNYVTPMYESTTKLRLADIQEGVPNSNLFKDFDVFASNEKINAEIELLKSDALLTKALSKIPFEVEIYRSGNIRKTELFNNSPILITPTDWSEKLKDRIFQLQVDSKRNFTILSDQGMAYKGHLGDTVLIGKSKLTLSVNESFLREKKDLKIADKYQFCILSRSKQIAQVRNQLDVMAVDKDVPVIRISYKSSHPDKSVDLPNALAEAYIEDYIENKYQAADVTTHFLNEQINKIGQKLSSSEFNILGYRDNKGITNIHQETETDLRKISQLKIQETNIKMNLEAIKDLEKYIQSGKDNFMELAPNFEAFNDLLSTEMVKKIKTLQAEKKDLLIQYTPNDEKVKVVDSKIDDLSSYLIESVRNTRKNLQTKYDNLTKDIEVAELAFVDVPEKERVMTILNRQFDIYQQSYNFLNQKKIEADIAKAAKVAFHRIITPATRNNTPVSPNRSIIKIATTIVGMMLSIFLIFLVHTMKARVNNVASIESRSMIPILCSVPKLKDTQEKENYFRKTIAEWEVREFMKDSCLLCLTGFKLNHGAEFIAKEITHVLKQQQRKVLLLHISEEASLTKGNVWKELLADPTCHTIRIPAKELTSLTSREWQGILIEKKSNYDHVILINSVFHEPLTTTAMAIADLNLACIDTRLTPAKLITEVDTLQQEFQLSHLFFAVNRVGYQPSFIREGIRTIRKLIQAFKHRRKNETI